MTTSTVQTLPAHFTQIYELNLNVFNFAARCVAAGDSTSLQRIGLCPDDIPLLEKMSLSELLEYSRCGAELTTALTSIRVDQTLRDALLIHGAPRDLMAKYFGMNSRLYRDRRSQLGVVGPTGRPTTQLADSSMEHRLWRLWTNLADEHDPAALRSKDHWLLIALELPSYLRSAWGLIQSWVRDPDMIAAFRTERLRTSRQQRESFELTLRKKHGI